MTLLLQTRHLRLSAVRTPWFCMMTICILFVTIALRQYSTLQLSQSSGGWHILPSAPVLLLLSALPDLALRSPPPHTLTYPPGSVCSCSGAPAVKQQGSTGRQKPIFFFFLSCNAGCWLVWLFVASRLHVWPDTTGCGVKKKESTQMLLSGDVWDKLWQISLRWGWFYDIFCYSPVSALKNNHNGSSCEPLLCVSVDIRIGNCGRVENMLCQAWLN